MYLGAIFSATVPLDEPKRRVSLPSNHLENQNIDSSNECSEERRPRSASTSTQVDPNLFGGN